MIIGVLKESQEGENRVAATPQTVKDLIKGGFEVHVQSNTGTPSFCLLYTSPSPRDRGCSRMPSSA